MSCALLHTAHMDALLPPLPRLAFIGAGRVAQVLAPALQQAGWPVVAVASRSADSAQRLAITLGNAARACALQDAVDRAELVLLTVPDDAIATTAAGLRWRAGVAVVHCSGATPISVLQPAADAGAATGGLHPLQIFSDPAGTVLAGCSAAIEAEGALDVTLHHLASTLGLHPLRLPPGARARYHASAAYAASYLLALLHEATQIWAGFGVAEPDALRALLPLARGTLDAAAARGLVGAQSGPISRGDAGVVQRQLADLATLGPDHAALFRAFGRRQLALVQAGDRLTPAALQRLAQVLGDPAAWPERA